MPTKLNPYISFKNNTREAMQFYQSVFGGELKMNTFNDFHAAQDPADGSLIMHAVLETASGLTLMASDTPARLVEDRPGTNIAISLSGENAAELTAYYQKLVQGGTVVMPLEQAPWGDSFGMCTDKFGVGWYVNIIAPKM
ncbi:MAG TPA: VOC family protein [Anaerolineales bacterium]|jgi:PhnB protein